MMYYVNHSSTQYKYNQCSYIYCYTYLLCRSTTCLHICTSKYVTLCGCLREYILPTISPLFSLCNQTYTVSVYSEPVDMLISTTIKSYRPVSMLLLAEVGCPLTFPCNWWARLKPSLVAYPGLCLSRDLSFSKTKKIEKEWFSKIMFFLSLKPNIQRNPMHNIQVGFR